MRAWEEEKRREGDKIVAEHRANVARAKEIYAEVGQYMVKSTAKKHGKPVKEVRDFVEVMIKGRPLEFIKLAVMARKQMEAA